MTLVRRLDAGAARAAVPALADILIDCVEGGASVSFMDPLDRAKAETFWHGVADRVARGECILLVAVDVAGRIDGTVQIGLGVPENQPHRADVAKLLVHRRARRQSIAAALMIAVEVEARQAGKTLLVLDTVSDSPAERLYRGLGWTAAGRIPNYALWPDGRFCDATVLYKALV